MPHPNIGDYNNPHYSVIRNRSRFLSAIHAGARPRPLHSAPVFGSRYFGATVPLVAGALTAPRRRPKTCCSVKP